MYLNPQKAALFFFWQRAKLFVHILLRVLGRENMFLREARSRALADKAKSKNVTEQMLGFTKIIWSEKPQNFKRLPISSYDL